MGKAKNDKQLEWFYKLLEKLKSADGYYNAVSAIIKGLDLPKETSHAKAEALLIEATNATFGDDSFKRDLVLAVFGLLQGFSHKEEPKDIQKRSMVRWRVDKFLMDSSYIQDNSKFESWETAKETVREDGKNEFKIIGDRLSKDVTTYIHELADNLYELNMLGEIEGFLDEASKKYPSSEKNYIDVGHLPVLANTQKCISKNRKSEQGHTGEQGELSPDQTKTIQRPQLELRIVIAVMTVLVTGIVVDCLYSYLSTRMAENDNEATPLIEDILVITPEIQLYPGKEALIQMDIVPDEANIDSVSCIPDDPEVATVDRRMVTAQPKWQEENHETQITVQGGVSPRNYVHVTVLPDPREQFTGADRPDGKNVEREGGQ